MKRSQENPQYDKGSQERNKDYEILVVPLANTGSKPWTVMIKTFNATIADSTVNCPWWPIDIAGSTVFDLCEPGIDDSQVLLPNVL